MDEEQLYFYLGERSDEELKDPVQEPEESDYDYTIRRGDFWKMAYKKERMRIPELREAGCLQMPCDDPPKEVNGSKKVSIWGNIRGKRRLEELEEEKAMQEEEERKKRLRLDEEVADRASGMKVQPHEAIEGGRRGVQA